MRQTAEGGKVGASARDVGAQTLRHDEAVSGRVIASRGDERKPFDLLEERGGGRKAPGREHDTALGPRGGDLPALRELNADHASGVGEQGLDLGLQGQGDGARVDERLGHPSENLEHGAGLVDAVVRARHRVGLVTVDEARRVGSELEPLFLQPVDEPGRMRESEAHEVLTHGVIGDALDVLEVGLGRILDAAFLLPLRPRRGNVATGNMKGAADLALLLHHQDPRSGPGAKNGAREAGGSRSHNNEVVDVHRLGEVFHVASLPATRPQQYLLIRALWPANRDLVSAPV